MRIKQHERLHFIARLNSHRSMLAVHCIAHSSSWRRLDGNITSRLCRGAGRVYAHKLGAHPRILGKEKGRLLINGDDGLFDVVTLWPPGAVVSRVIFRSSPSNLAVRRPPNRLCA
jgi:hypothetical protein